MTHETQVSAGYVITSKGGRMSMTIAVVLFIVAVITYIYAEMNWASITGTSIGVGTSAYASVLFIRAGVLACLSAAAALIGFAERRYNMV